jgi:uncharacterized sulfatase
MRIHWAVWAGIVLAGWASPAAVSAAEPVKHPNVVFIVIDDLRCTLGCYGDKDVRSPNIDRLAARGMRFDHAYCQYTVCNPSRTSFLTGLRPDTTGIFDNRIYFRTKLPDVVTLPQLARQNGYYSASLGKIFHLGQTIDDIKKDMNDPKSWDLARTFQGTPRGKRGEGRNMTGGKLAWCRWLSAEGDDNDQPDGQIATEAVRLLTEKRDKPLFLGVGFNKPHDPFIAPKKYFDLYPLDKIRLPSLPQDRSTPVPLAVPKNPAIQAFTDRERREFKRAYLAGTSFVDAQVGRVLDALDRERLWDRTVVVLIGDHGYHLGEHNWWNKATVFEWSARPPLLVWAPGMKAAGKPCERLVEFLDLYPTLAELCGLPAPARLEGRSFRPLLDDPTRPGKAAAYTQVQRGPVMGRSVRTERWRYTEWDGGKRGVELYDHRRDPGEYHNLAEDRRYAEQVKELKALLAKKKP